MKSFILCLVLSCIALSHRAQEYVSTKTAEIQFTSEAPLEIISARSSQCMGVLNMSNGEFAFRVQIASFEGFNNPLQREHFCENYMEISDFPTAEFRGRLLGNLELEGSDTLLVKAKGELTVHGVSDERIIDLQLVQLENTLSVASQFQVELSSHGIEIPRIVYHKVAEVIYVVVSGMLE